MPPKEEQIKLDSLSPQQLVELRQNLNAEIQRLMESGQALARASNTFAGTKKSVEQLGASKEGR